jgi:hypothetical protein
MMLLMLERARLNSLLFCGLLMRFEGLLDVNTNVIRFFQILVSQPHGILCAVVLVKQLFVLHCNIEACIV